MTKAGFALIFASFFAAAAAQAEAAHPAAGPAQASWPWYDATIADAKTSMMTDPKVALEKARNADTFAQSQANSPHRTEALATSYWLEGEALTRLGQIDQARAAINKAITLAAAGGKYTKLNGSLALSQARLADATGDIALALKSYHRAYDIFTKLNVPRYQSIALQGLGAIYDEAHDFNHEIEYYRRASQVYSTEPGLELSVANNIGYGLQQLGRYGEALMRFEYAQKLARALKSPFLEANILTNIASVYAKMHRFEDAEKAADRALKLLGPKDESGQAPFVWGVKGQIEYERGHLGQAAADVDRAFKGIDLKTTIAPFRDMHEIAYKTYKAAGNNALALAHLEAFKRLDDEGRTLAASANLALMGAQFDFANQQFEIEHLKSEQLKRDISLRESRAATQRAIFAALLLMAVLAVLWMSWRHTTLKRHRNELRKTLGERNVEIERRTEVEARLRLAMVAAEEANRAKSHFLANMSHELRTPLNAIIGFSNMMTSAALPPAKNMEYAGDIHSAGRRLLMMLNDILDMARIDARSIPLDDNDVRLPDVAQKAIYALKDEHPGHERTIRISDRAPDVRLRCDENRVCEMLVHLLSNAVKFTGPNGEIEIAIERAGDGVDLIVRDNGLGIPRDKLSLVLEPFGQAEGAYARAHGGIGLGLPIVKSLVELHGGTFTLASEYGTGTQACVHFPADRVVPETARRTAMAS